MKKIMLMATALLLPTLAMADVKPSDLVGTWRLDAKMLLASGTMYTTFSEGGACSQILQIKAMGMTQWSVDRCTWSIQQSALSMKILSSPTQPDKVGESNTVTVNSVSKDALVVTNKKKETQTWARVPELPADFAAEFAKNYPASPTAPATQ